MTSFQIGVKPSRRAAGRFVAKVRRKLIEALAEERATQGITQSDIARVIDVHRSVISRELNGRADITLGRVAELAYALGRDIDFELPRQQLAPGANTPETTSPVVLVSRTSDAPISLAQAPAVVGQFSSFQAAL